MDKLIDIVFEWAEKRWPLLFLFAIPFVFLFVQKYSKLSFRQAVWHGSFWIGSGTLFLVSGVLDWIYLPQRLYGIWPSGLLALIGVILLIGSLWQRRLPSLPEDKLVVAIARFYPVSDGAKEEANNLPYRIEQDLLRKADEGAPLEIKRLSTQVVGPDEQARRKRAIELGTSKEAHAHVVLWGDVLKEEELNVEIRLTVARQLRKAPIEEGRLGEFTSNEPKHLEFKKRLSTVVADTVMIVYGLAYFKAQSWDRAMEILDHVDSNEGRLFKALCLRNRAVETTNPQQDLRAAIETYETLMGPVPGEPAAQADVLALIADLNRADAIATLSLFSSPKESLAYLCEAMEVFRTALQIFTPEEFLEDWITIQNNLGNALVNLGTRMSGEEGNNLFREAEEIYRTALEVVTREDLLEKWAMIQINLGNVLYELGTRASGEEGINLLKKSVEAYRAALQIFIRKTFSQVWAATQTMLGLALSELGIRVGGEEGNNLLREAVLESGGVFKVIGYTKKKFPMHYAMAMTAWGNAYCNLGISTALVKKRGAKDTMEYLIRGLVIHTGALEVYKREELPQQWAMAQTNLGRTRLLLGMAMYGEEGIKDLREAEEGFRAALQVLTREELPQQWAMTQTNLGTALRELGARASGEEGVRYFNEAIASFDDVMSSIDQAEYPKLHREILTYKSQVMKLKESLSTSKP